VRRGFPGIRASLAFTPFAAERGPWQRSELSALAGLVVLHHGQHCLRLSDRRPGRRFLRDDNPIAVHHLSSATTTGVLGAREEHTRGLDRVLRCLQIHAHHRGHQRRRCWSGSGCGGHRWDYYRWRRRRCRHGRDRRGADCRDRCRRHGRRRGVRSRCALDRTARRSDQHYRGYTDHSAGHRHMIHPQISPARRRQSDLLTAPSRSPRQECCASVSPLPQPKRRYRQVAGNRIRVSSRRTRLSRSPRIGRCSPRPNGPGRGGVSGRRRAARRASTCRGCSGLGRCGA